MVKRRESKGTSSKEKTQSTEDVLSDQSNISNPSSATTDWLKINVPFKNPEFKVGKFLFEQIKERVQLNKLHFYN